MTPNKNKPEVGDTGFDTKQYKGDADKNVSSTLENTKRAAKDAVASSTDAVSDARDYARDKLADAGRQIGDGYDTVKDWAAESYDAGAERTRQLARHGRQNINYAGDRTVEFFGDYPLMLGAVGFAGGVLLGALLPRTRSEDRHLGRWRDDLEREGKRYGRDAVASARQFATRQMHEARMRAEREMHRAADKSKEGSSVFEPEANQPSDSVTGTRLS